MTIESEKTRMLLCVGRPSFFLFFYFLFFYFVTSHTNQALSETLYSGNNVCDFTHKTSSVQTMEYHVQMLLDI